MTGDLQQLRALARAYGVQIAYKDGRGRRRVASREALLATLRSLGTGIEALAGVPDAIRRRKLELWRRVLPPVAVAWDGRSVTLTLRLPSGALSARSVCRVTLEDGTVVEKSFRAETLPSADSATVDGTRFTERALGLPGPWPKGYHRVRVMVGRTVADTLVISAPRRAYGVAPSNAEPRWGVFAPLYALHSKHSWGAGDFADLAKLAEWTQVLGGSVVATLPMLASFLDDPVEVSPYRPVSRLFWNELFIAVERVPDLEHSTAARALLRSSRRRIARLRSSDDVDHEHVMSAKRRVLERIASDLSRPRRAELRAFRAAHPEVDDYARFRATHERRGCWETWPARLRDGVLRGGDYDAAAARYHTFVQWIAADQIAGAARDAGFPGLCLDLPLGAHPDGYDVWRHRATFARESDVGAPPDEFFANGQCWAVPPIHPERSREQGHEYFRSCLRHSMRVGGALRIDHVMGLHRLLWIPRGSDPGQGVYVRYPAEELYATLCLESVRHRCLVVGEDLGTVPPQVRPALRRHNMRRTFILQGSTGLSSSTVQGVAVLGTHDMPTFAAFLRGLDIGERARLGLIPRKATGRQHAARSKMRSKLIAELRRRGWMAGRRDAVIDALRGCLAFLSGSSAEIVLVNLEDLWLETHAQNVPGTSIERRNWRGKARYSLDELPGVPRVLRILRDVDRGRHGVGGNEA